MAALPEPEFRVPDVVGEFVGWRAWQVVGTDIAPRLCSVTAPGIAGLALWSCIWPTDRWMLAVCPHGHDDPPHEGCRCGIYAARELAHLIDYGYGHYDDLTDKVIGQCGLAGKVIPGQQGWKAERARILRLIVPWERARRGWAEALGRLYRVPVGYGQTWTMD